MKIWFILAATLLSSPVLAQDNVVVTYIRTTGNQDPVVRNVVITSGGAGSHLTVGGQWLCTASYDGYPKLECVTNLPVPTVVAVEMACEKPKHRKATLELRNNDSLFQFVVQCQNSTDDPDVEAVPAGYKHSQRYLGAEELVRNPEEMLNLSHCKFTSKDHQARMSCILNASPWEFATSIDCNVQDIGDYSTISYSVNRPGNPSSDRLQVYCGIPELKGL